MRHAVSKFVVVVVLFWGAGLWAQDIQELYEAAKEALLNGNYMLALTRISDAQAQIESDPNLDPNGVFRNKLLPKLQQTANTMANIIAALEALHERAQLELTFPDLAPTVEAVGQYTQIARSASEKILAQRDSILASHELDPEFANALQRLPVVRQIEQFASVGIVDRLSTKFSVLAQTLTDSIQSINARFATMAENLEKLKKSAAASRAERKKLEEQLAALSQERNNYMHAISEILTGTPTGEAESSKMIILDQNLDAAFDQALETEIKRVAALSEVDSLGYKELVKNFERMKQYNEIFIKNHVATDKSNLLAQYEAALQRVKVTQPEKTNYAFYIGIALAIIILAFIIYRLVVSLQRKSAEQKSPDQDEFGA